MQRLTPAATALFGVVALSAVRPARAQSYAFTVLDVPGVSGYTQAFGVNASGQVVGYSSLGGFLYSGGTYTSIDVPGASFTTPFGINAGGQIVGYSSLGSFRYSAGAYDVSFIPDRLAHATAINDRGQVAGMRYEVAGGPHGFVLSGGEVTSIDLPGATPTYVQGINAGGQVVGWGYGGAAIPEVGFLYRDGAFSLIRVPGADGTNAWGINTAGQIVGTYSVGNEQHGYLYDAGTFVRIDVPGVQFTTAYGINDDGQIVGTFVDPSGGIHGFLATPVVTPEPRTFALTLVGVAVFGVGARRRHRAVTGRPAA